MESVSVDSREAELLGVKKGFHMLKLQIYHVYEGLGALSIIPPCFSGGTGIILKFEFPGSVW